MGKEYPSGYLNGNDLTYAAQWQEKEKFWKVRHARAALWDAHKPAYVTFLAPITHTSKNIISLVSFTDFLGIQETERETVPLEFANTGTNLQ